MAVWVPRRVGCSGVHQVNDYHDCVGVVGRSELTHDALSKRFSQLRQRRGDEYVNPRVRTTTVPLCSL